MVADQLDYVVGVDPHRDQHAVGCRRSREWCVVFETCVAADSGGYAEALVVAETYAPGRRVFAVEGTGSYGAGLTRFLTASGEQVFEVGRLLRQRHGSGKTDALDAVRAARSVHAQERPATPRTSGEREALRALMAAREGAVNAKRAGLCQLRDLLVTTPEPLRAELTAAVAGTAPRASRGNPTCTAQRPGVAWRAARAPLRRSPHPAADRRRTRARPRDQDPDREARTTAPRPARRRAAPWQPKSCSPGPTKTGSPARPRLPGSPASPRSPPPPDKRSATASTEAATDNSTAPSTRPSSPNAASTNPRSRTSNAAPAKAKHDEKQTDASNATSPATPTDSSKPERHCTLDKHRSITGACRVAFPAGSRPR